MSRNQRHWLIVTSLCAVAFFVGLGQAPIGRIQEARVLEGAREMLQNRDFLVPHLDGQPRLQKTPLAYWLAAAGYTITGKTSEGTGRLYSAVAGTLTALLLLAYCSLAGRPQAGFWAALTLVTSRLWLKHSRLAETDVLLSLGIAAALLAFALGWEQTSGRRRQLWSLAGWMALAVACMAKGPAALVLPLATILVAGIAERGLSSLRLVLDPLGLLLFAAVVVPWFWAVSARQDFAIAIFWNEIAVTASGEVHSQGFLYSLVYYLVRVWPDLAPWSLLLPFAGTAAIRAFRADSLARFSVLWTVSMFIPLEVIGSRQPHYLLPVFPALALLTGWWLSEKAHSAWRRLAVWVLPLPVAISLVLAFGGNRVIQPEHFARKDFAQAIAPLVRGRPLSIYGTTDPILSFYLKRTIAETTIERLRAQVASGETVLVLEPIDPRMPRPSALQTIPGGALEFLASQRIKDKEQIFLYRLSSNGKRSITETG